jgi:hypothetical protein
LAPTKDAGLRFLLSATSPATSDRICKIIAPLAPWHPDCTAADWDKDLQVELVPRSTYSVIYYLGEVTRRELYPDFSEKARPLLIRASTASQPNKTCADATDGRDVECDAIFLTSKGPGEESFLKVQYDRGWYNVVSGQQTQKTYEVLDLVTEMLALSRSAKDLPSSSVFTITSH